MKTIRIFLLILIIIGVILLFTQSMWVPRLVNMILKWEGQSAPITSDYKNSTYIIEGQPITLIDGKSEVAAAPGSASKVVTEYFGDQAAGDLNGDGKDDIGFIITQNSGGSGTFYYAVVALKIDNGYQGTNGILLGDRIAPKTTEIKSGELVVNYADRKAGESMTTQPSVGLSKYFKVSGTTLVLVK